MRVQWLSLDFVIDPGFWYMICVIGALLCVARIALILLTWDDRG